MHEWRIERRQRRRRRTGLAAIPSIPSADDVIAIARRHPGRVALGILGIGALVGLVVLIRNRRSIQEAIMEIVSKVVGVGKEAAFAAVLPADVNKYANQILHSARKFGVSPWVLAGIMYRETHGGALLKPPGPTGTGDFSKRTPGIKYRQPSGAYYVVGPSGLPEDGLGWGRGLVSIDWGVHNEWMKASNWKDPQTSIDKAATIVLEHQQYFQRPAGGPITVDAWRITKGLPFAGVQSWSTKYGLYSQGPYKDPRPLTGDKLLEATLAAYNSGPNGVLQAVAAGLPASAPTSGNDYAAWVLTRVASWASKFV